MDTAVFGHMSWDVMDWVAAVVVAHPGSTHVVRAALTYLVSLCFLLPCEPCRLFYLVSWCTMPPPSEAHLLKHPETLQHWVYNVRSIVTSKVNVTKHKLLCPTRCITPGLSRFALARRRDVLSVLGAPENSIKVRDVLAVALMGADACRRHKNETRRVKAWHASWEALKKLASVSSLSRDCKPAFDVRGVGGGASNTPFQVATAAVNAWRVCRGGKPVAPFVLMNSLKRGLGPLKDYMSRRFET